MSFSVSALKSNQKCQQRTHTHSLQEVSSSQQWNINERRRGWITGLLFLLPGRLIAGYKNWSKDSQARPESRHWDDITNTKNDMRLKMDESLWRTTASSRADYLTVSCDLKLAFSSPVTHSQKSSKRGSPQESFPGVSRFQECRKECTDLQSLQCKEPSLTKKCDMEGSNKAPGAAVVQRNLWHTCVNTSLTSVCFVAKVHMLSDLIGYCRVCASGTVALLPHCNFECKSAPDRLD